MVASSRLPTSRNTNPGPALAVENHRNVPALDRGCWAQRSTGNQRIDPRRGLKDPVVDAAVQRFPGHLVDCAPRDEDERVGDAVAIEGVVAARTELAL